ncbi:MAG: flagellar hook-length control protein FliK [Methylococcales bacterium]|nr:flagellar hook-length control protein FliK [Methylococcales bacterium]
MDIILPKSSQNTVIFSTDKITSLNLKINQKLEAIIVNNEINTRTLALEIFQPNKSILVQSNQAIETKQGQTFQLLVTKTTPVAEFKVLTSNAGVKPANPSQTQSHTKPIILNELILKQLTPSISLAETKSSSIMTPTILIAKIIAIHDNKIQLKLDSLSNTQPIKATQKKQIPTSFKFENNPSLITLKKNDLISSPQITSSHVVSPPSYKLGQKIQLINISEKGVSPKFKILNTTPEKLNAGQTISATILEIKNNKVKLGLHLNNYFQHKKTSINPSSPTITLNKSQLINQSIDNDNLSDKKSLLFDKQNLKQGQLIKFQVIKTGNKPEFKLIENTSTPDINKKVVEVIKQSLPIQESSSLLINQLIKNLSSINKNESIPDNLKRLARSLINSIPHIKNERVTPKQLKQFVLNSGLFLEAKLSTSTEKNDLNLQDDFKNQLLKIHHALKQELEVKNQQKPQTNEVDIIKEMQQKTESSLAKTLLNQLSSLPKEDGIKQAWIIELPFLNNGFSESVKIEINREQQDNKETNQENWAVTITIVPPEMGAIYCKLSCFDKTINTRFWSDSKDVVSKITQSLDYLKTQFEKSGIETGHMSAHLGSKIKHDHQNTSNQSLFDQEA